MLERLARRFSRFAVVRSASCLVVALAAAVPLLLAGQAAAAEAEIALILPARDGGTLLGQSILRGVEQAIADANALRTDFEIKLSVYEDGGDPERTARLTQDILRSGALITIGPISPATSAVAIPILAESGLAAIHPSGGQAAAGTSTTFRLVETNERKGELLALYVVRALGERNAIVLVGDDPYAQGLRAGFDRMAAEIGLETSYQSAPGPGMVGSGAVVLLMREAEAAVLVPQIRAAGAGGPILTGDGLGQEGVGAIATEAGASGSIDGLYALAPLILDSANGESLAFADAFMTRHGVEPEWPAFAGYDAARLAIAAIASTASLMDAGAETAALRAGVVAFLSALDRPEIALGGLLGPIWFDQNQGGGQPMRVGRYSDGAFESAAIQLVAAPSPDPAELDEGSVFVAGTLGPLRLQQIVYTGVFLNEVRRIVLRSTFEADLYLWLRFMPIAGTFPDPADITFPNLVDGDFDPAEPAERRTLPDGSVYELWRVQGEFRNDFDLRRFPFDHQSLGLSFFNTGADGDRIVYVLDERMGPGPLEALHDGGSDVASPEAFRSLAQWTPLAAAERRMSLRTESALGDPDRTGLQNFREWSGFVVSVDLERRTMATVAKTLLPLFLMGLIMLASLYFPRGLIREKVMVAVTAALSAAVLLSAVNTQLGEVGYTVVAEYAFFVFFGLSLLCIIAVVVTEHYRLDGHHDAAARVDFWTRALFLSISTMMALVAVAMFLTR